MRQERANGDSKVRAIRKILFFGLFSLIFSGSAGAEIGSGEHQQCLNSMLHQWVEESEIPMGSLGVRYYGSTFSQTIVKKYSKTDTDYCFPSDPGCYCTTEEEDEGICTVYKTRYRTVKKTVPRVFAGGQFVVKGQNPAGTVDLSFQFNSHFFTSTRTKFGSGEVQQRFFCCLPHREITVYDHTNGFSHSFSTSRFACKKIKEQLRIEAESAKEKIRMTQDQTLLCKKFGSESRRWNKTETDRCRVFGDKDAPDGYICDSKKVTSHFRGCRADGDISGLSTSWDFYPSLDGEGADYAQVTNEFNQSLLLSCQKNSEKLAMSLRLSPKDGEFLAILAQNIQSGQAASMKAKTNRSASVEVSRQLTVDVGRRSIDANDEMSQQLLKRLRADRALSITIDLQGARLEQAMQFSLKGSSSAIQSLSAKCKNRQGVGELL